MAEQTSAERFEAALEAEVLRRVPHALHRLGRSGVERAKGLIRGDFQAGWDAATAAAEERYKEVLTRAGLTDDDLAVYFDKAAIVTERDALRQRIAELEA